MASEKKQKKDLGSSSSKLFAWLLVVHSVAVKTPSVIVPTWVRSPLAMYSA